MDAVFKIKGEEFNEALFKKIKALLKKAENSSVIISIVDEQSAYHRALQKSISELEQPEKLLSFTMEDLETYNKKSK